LAASFGRGAMTNHWRDFKNSDVILVIGANPAENHPCGWKWAHVGRDERGTRIIHVDPRFTRTSAIADVFVPIRAGADTAFFGGLINYVLEHELYQEEYVKLHTNASFIVAEDYSFEDGLFSGYDEAERTYDTASWDYERESAGTEEGAPPPGLGQGTGPIDAPSFARVDPTLEHPRCVFQLMREHYSRYTPELVSQITGIPVDKFTAVAEEFGATGAADKSGSVVYAVGLTHHTSGVQIIRGIGLLQMLLGNVGIPGGGVNAERGHANIQGNTDNAISWEILPGYLAIPRPGMETMADYLDEVPAQPLRPNSINFFGSNYKKFLVSQMKAFFGESATALNDFAYSWIPKPEKNSSWLTIHDEARAGRLDGIIYGGFTGVTVGPDSTRMAESLSKLKWLVIMDPLPTSASEFWHAPGTDPADIETEALFLPATHWIEKAGSFTNSGRWAQWKHKVLPATGESRDDNWILGNLYQRLRDLYEEEGGAFPDPVLNIHWPYSDPTNPGLEELAREANGFDIESGEQLSTFVDLADDGTTASGDWIYCGSWTEEGNQMDRRGVDDPTGLGYFHNWAWSWPLNRRILYNRASADADGQPWDPTRPGIRWNGSKWVGDVPDITATSGPDEGKGAFIMTGEGVGRLFAPKNLTTDGPFPEHYEQTETPIDNLLSGTRRNPAAFLYEDAPASFAEDDAEYPYVATTYRVTEHEHYVTQNVPYLVEAMPDFFVELPVELAEEKGIVNGGRVRVTSKRGSVEGVAMVTKRMRPLRVGDGKVVYQVGIPVHWHYAGGKGERDGAPMMMANLLTPYIGDANVRTPEYKGFLVNIEKP
jgi:formate dehydrogenase major subunit